jgi:hypothetical protein
VAAIPDAVLDRLLVRGSPPARRARVREYLDAGVDTVLLALQSGEADPDRRREVLRGALGALAPAAG